MRAWQAHAGQRRAPSSTAARVPFSSYRRRVKRDHYLRFVRALALVGGLSGCTAPNAPASSDAGPVSAMDGASDLADAEADAWYPTCAECVCDDFVGIDGGGNPSCLISPISSICCISGPLSPPELA